MDEFTPVIQIEEEKNTSESKEPLWLSVSETATILGVSSKTIRRSIQSKEIRYKLVKERYLIDISSVISLYMKDKKLRNKINNHGIGQYIKEWSI